MNLLTIILVFHGWNMLWGVLCLKLIKVVIPAYKLRGESALLECHYELNNLINSTKWNKGSSSISNSNSNTHHRNRNHQYSYPHFQQQQQKQQEYPYKSFEESRLRDYNRLYDNIEQNDETESLYSVKWYKDNEEFYRYVPKANPPQQSYRVDGIRVDHQHSDSTKVLLRGLTLKSTGLYRCEVSAEAPNFSSDQGEGRMDIVYLPRDGPHINGKEDQYQIGDILNLNCTSGKSHPASHLQWVINDELLAERSRILVHYNDTVHPHGLITSTLGLQFILDARHFQDGAMRVKCLASVSPVLWKGGQESVVQRRPGLIDNREAMLLVLSSACRCYSYNLIFLISTVISLLRTIQSFSSLIYRSDVKNKCFEILNQ